MKMARLTAALLAAGTITLAATWTAPSADAQRARRGGGNTPDAMYNQLVSGNSYWKNNYTGEDFAWHAVNGMGRFLSTYESTGNTAYLDAGVKYYDALIAKMATGPDGYKGFIGPFEYNPDDKTNFWCDDHVGDALLFDGMLDFALKVERDPQLKEKYGDKAMGYVNDAKRDFFDKWDSRGTLHQDGPFAFYVGWDHYGLPGQYTNWKVEPACSGQSGVSLPFNKNIDIGALALRIWQVTGDEKYKHKAEQLFGYMKSRMSQYNGAMHWNYWEPTGIWDLGIDRKDLLAGEWNPAVASKTMRMWIAVHPERNYQENEMANIMKAYNGGIVFTEADMKKMIDTNLKVMWNGNEENPRFANSDADLYGHPGKPVTTPGQHAGTLWTPLAQLDPEIRKLASRRRGAGNGAAPSFDRLDVKGPVKIPEVYAQFPLGNVRSIDMAAAMPSIFPIGETSAFICKLIAKGELEVALYSADGKTKIVTLKKGLMDGGSDGRAGVCYFLFDGTLPDGKTAQPGNYRVRWTVAGDGYREFPITIEPKK